MKTDLRPYHWHENNTQCHTWFERDRANVRLEDLRGNEILCLWDQEVIEFIEAVLKNYSLKSIEELRENTTVIEVDDETIIYQNY